MDIVTALDVGRIEVSPYALDENPNSVDVQLVRLDRLHPYYGGNKWFKLKHNLAAARDGGHTTVLTYGGAYSNHLVAAAAACRDFGFKLVCVVRGERAEPLNPVLSFVERLGGNLHFVSRESYRKKSEAAYVEAWTAAFGPCYVIPEGGANALGVIGCAEIPSLVTVPFDYLVCACGTFTTLAGISLGVAPHQEAVGVGVLKADGYGLRQTNALIEDAVTEFPALKPGTFSIEENYHFGGYAKSNAALDDFAVKVSQHLDFAVDTVYTAKLLFAVTDMAARGRFHQGATVAVLASGLGKLL